MFVLDSFSGGEYVCWRLYSKMFNRDQKNYQGLILKGTKRGGEAKSRGNLENNARMKVETRETCMQCLSISCLSDISLRTNIRGIYIKLTILAICCYIENNYCILEWEYSVAQSLCRLSCDETSWSEETLIWPPGLSGAGLLSREGTLITTEYINLRRVRFPIQLMSWLQCTKVVGVFR